MGKVTTVKAAYVRPGGPLFPDQAKAKRLGVDTFLWDATDPGGQQGPLSQVLKEMRNAGGKVGTTRSDAWEPNLTPEAFGGKLAADVRTLSGTAQHATIADIERHDASYVVKALKTFRDLLPQRFLYWTMEPLQFAPSWITDELVGYLAHAPYTWVVPQLYRGDMSPVSERACVNEILARGLPAFKIKCYYDRACERFDGILFDFANIAG